MNLLTLLLHSACPKSRVRDSGGDNFHTMEPGLSKWLELSQGNKLHASSVWYRYKAKAVKSWDDKNEKRHCQVYLTKTTN
jgi:hypothetical protein